MSINELKKYDFSELPFSSAMNAGNGIYREKRRERG